MADAPKNEAPYTIVRHRTSEGTIYRGIRIVRYWRNKETRSVVEVRRVLRVVPENVIRIVFYDPITPEIPEHSDGLKNFQRDHEPIGNMNVKAV